MSGYSLRIGLLAHTPLQQRTLRTLVEECGHQVGSCMLIADLVNQPDLAPDDPNLNADAWVVACETESTEGIDEGSLEGTEWLDREQWSGRHQVPVIFCDGEVPAAHAARYPDWSRRLKDKLVQLTGVINLAQSAGGSARRVWVLASSTGGPAAVKQFLAKLPAGLGIGFIYVQHIDTGFKDTLVQAMSRGSHYRAHMVEHGSVVKADEVAVVSPDYATELLPNGTFVVSGNPWSAPYRPSADYIVANVAHSYGERSGVIVFTGMGDDGAASSRLMRQKGGRVWIQTPESCTSDSMPQATLAAGCVDFAGTPEGLAEQLAKHLQAVSDQPPTAQEPT